jgi:hypothetical protein
MNMVKNKMKVIALVLVAVLILSSVYIYYGYFTEKEIIQEKTEESAILDDRISPLENQGVVLEVLRIRHRGLLQKLITSRNSWKNPPTFYFISNMDGLEYASKNVEQHGRTTEILFNTWDTMFQENKIVKDSDEEQETSTVTLTIVEQVKSGLFGRKTTDVERDSLTVTYDYRTGRWSGDDNFKDYDGYGHYLGETFEIWFNLYQFDYDNDFIPYWTEVNIFGTDPMVDDSTRDPDGDGIPTAWEWKWGYDPFTWDDHERLDPDLDGIENSEEYQMADWFADPFIQDMYIEVDGMERGGLFDPPHYLFEESKQGVIERFAEHNIRVYVDDGWPDSPIHGGGDVLPHFKKISIDSGMMLQFYDNYFPKERRGIFRYLVIGHGGGITTTSKNNINDCMQILSFSVKNTLLEKIKNFFLFSAIPTERGIRISLGGLVLHELAHSCSVDQDNCGFGGIDNMSYASPVFPKKSYVETWGQYRSVLNYIYSHDLDVFDLSHGDNGPPYDQNDWGYMFVGFFQYNARFVEEPYYEPQGGASLVQGEWRVNGYTYDANLTEKFVEYIGDWSPVDPTEVNWSVYKLVDTEQNPHARMIKVFAQPKIKTTQQWELFQEGDLDSEGNMQFYSFDDILNERLS